MYSETCELFLKCKDCKVLDIFSTETTLILYMENVWNKGNPKTMQNREDINENDKKTTHKTTNHRITLKKGQANKYMDKKRCKKLNH